MLAGVQPLGGLTQAACACSAPILLTTTCEFTPSKTRHNLLRTSFSTYATLADIDLSDFDLDLGGVRSDIVASPSSRSRLSSSELDGDLVQYAKACEEAVDDEQMEERIFAFDEELDVAVAVSEAPPTLADIFAVRNSCWESP